MRPICKQLASIVALVVIASSSTAAVHASSGIHPSTTPTRGIQTTPLHMPLAFTANQGQWPDSILFRARSGGATLWFTRTGAHYQFRGRVPGAAATADVVTERLKAVYVGANPTPDVQGEGRLGYRCNFFIGDDPDGWYTDVPNYSAMILEDLYPGIDLRYYGRNGRMEYDFIVSPGADPTQIRIRYEGPRTLCVTPDGDLIVETGLATVTEHAPYAYQLIDGEESPVPATYAMSDEYTFGFQVPPDLAAGAPLIIDPVLTYSTYLGGDARDEPVGIAADVSGSAYVVGETESTDFYVVNEYQGDQTGTDVFVTKFSPDGDSLIYSTYLGGSSASDFAGDIVVDANGHAYVTGYTNSTDFPTQNPFQTHQGGNDAFICKLSPAGNALIYGTYLGGSSAEECYGIALDDRGCAYVTGQTFSGNFPLELPIQATPLGFGSAFVTKLSPAGDSLRYSTYIGGDDEDRGQAIAVDAQGQAYVTGRTSSTDFPTVNPYQASPGGGGIFENDVFVIKLSPIGDALIYGTYIGGADSEAGEGIAIDGDGHAYVCGDTRSPDYPLQNPFDSVYGNRECFVTKLSPDGDSLVYSTYLGGSDQDYGAGVGLDTKGRVYVAGRTRSVDFPLQATLQDSLGGSYDAFVAQFTQTGDGLVFSTYLGGPFDDRTNAVTVGGGTAYITGLTGSGGGSFPLENPLQPSYGGLFDGFVAKMGCPIALTGDVDLSGALTSADIIGLVNYVFKSGSEPLPCTAAGDVDCSGQVTSADIIYMVNYVFKGQEAPCDACSSALAADC